MDTASFWFVGYGLAVALISNLSRSRAWRFWVLMLASLIFLGLLVRNPLTLLPLVGFLLLGYLALILLQRGWSRIFVWSILTVALVYIWLKKYTFLPQASFLHFPYLALGLSYVFFRVLHLLIETRDSQRQQRIGLGAYLLYTLNFTTFISGPIQRYDEFARDQFATEPIGLQPAVIGVQAERIVRGFFKVNVLGTLLQAFFEDARLQLLHPLPPELKLFAAVRVAVFYPLFLYANFSGYIDIVIALARLARVRLPENFNRPLFSTSFLDFWSRWHITLSTWFKTYVYNPMLLSLMRRISSQAAEPFISVFCFFVAFFLVGVWHGRTSEFIFYGFLQGGGVAVNKLWQVELTRILGRKQYRALAKNPLYVAFSRGLTFCWFAFTLAWFWGSWHQIHQLAASLGAVLWIEAWLGIWMGASVVLQVWEWLRARLLSIRTPSGPLLQHRYVRIVYASALGFIAVLLTVLINSPAPGIVYRAF